jgi:hypothetical protein
LTSKSQQQNNKTGGAMSGFLEFLNTASAERLTEIAGISPSLAANLVAARPFETVEECLKVRGMGRNLLARVQAAFENADSEKVSPTDAPLSIEAQPEPVPSGKITSPEEEARAVKRPSFGERLGTAFLWFFRAFLRLILIVLVIGGIGAAIYYGAPLVNERFLLPVEQNTARIAQLETEVETFQTQLDAISRQLAAANEVIVELNNRQTEESDRLDALEKSVEAQTANLTKLVEIQTALETALKENNDQTLQTLRREVTLTRILDMLARARLYLAQSNFGLAREDVQTARDLLADLQRETNDEAQLQALQRLDLTLNNLPEFPVVASGDLEIAWQIMMTGKPIATAIPEALSSPTVIPEATQTATPTP